MNPLTQSLNLTRMEILPMVASLKGCVISQGDSLEVVLKNIKEAIELYLEDIDEFEREKN